MSWIIHFSTSYFDETSKCPESAEPGVEGESLWVQGTLTTLNSVSSPTLLESCSGNEMRAQTCECFGTYGAVSPGKSTLLTYTEARRGLTRIYFIPPLLWDSHPGWRGLIHLQPQRVTLTGTSHFTLDISLVTWIDSRVSI